MRLTNIKVSLKLPYIGGVEGDWKPDEGEKSAAWEMYVELITRVSVAELGPEEGLLREALSSLYTLFDTTRSILRTHGPGVAKPKSGGDYSFGFLAVAILNTVVRPLLAKWHPLLADYENSKPPDVSAFEHERKWEYSRELRGELADAHATLRDYANLLAQVSDVPRLYDYHVATQGE